MNAQTTAGDLRQGFRSPGSVISIRPGVRDAAGFRRPYAAVEWIALAAVAIAIIATAVAFAAESLPDEVRTRPVRVEQGDSLWGLAGANPVEGLSTAETAELIRRVNGMRGSVVHAGELIQVPDSSAPQGSLAQK